MVLELSGTDGMKREDAPCKWKLGGADVMSKPSELIYKQKQCNSAL